MKSTAQTVPAYLDALPADRRAALSTLRELIQRIVPAAAESIPHGMPFYTLGEKSFCALVAQKNHLALHVCDPVAVEAHRARLGKMQCGKGCLRFRELADVPMDLIADLLRDSAARRTAGGGGA